MLAKSKHCYFNYICYEAVQVCLVPTCRLWAVPRSEHDPGDNRELLQVAAPLPSVLAVCCSAFPVQTIQSCVFTSELACCWCHPPRGALGRAVGAASGLQALPCPWKIASKRRQERRASLSTIICRALFLCLWFSFKGPFKWNWIHYKVLVSCVLFAV